MCAAHCIRRRAHASSSVCRGSMKTACSSLQDTTDASSPCSRRKWASAYADTAMRYHADTRCFIAARFLQPRDARGSVARHRVARRTRGTPRHRCTCRTRGIGRRQATHDARRCTRRTCTGLDRVNVSSFVFLHALDVLHAPCRRSGAAAQRGIEGVRARTRGIAATAGENATGAARMLTSAARDLGPYDTGRGSSARQREHSSSARSAQNFLFLNFAKRPKYRSATYLCFHLKRRTLLTSPNFSS